MLENRNRLTDTEIQRTHYWLPIGRKGGKGKIGEED